ncbi:hypothetical protein [Cellulomonas sp.]|uniref:phosphotransferase-like protein n=1 Tax=Cellulomonas sp. TaxID=40001 RepID=UPI00344CDD01
MTVSDANPPPRRQSRCCSKGGLPTVWIGVHCAPDIAARREQTRGDRQRGMWRACPSSGDARGRRDDGDWVSSGVKAR